MNWIANYLRDSSVKDLNVDGGDRLLIHGKILARKPMLQDVFNSFHHAFAVSYTHLTLPTNREV